MAENSGIGWTDHSFAPWFGCTKVSPACDGCYAEHMTVTRFGKVTWGPQAERRRSAASTWRGPIAWNRKAAKDGARPFVFCSHLSDVFDNAVPPEWRRDLFDLIRATPNLTWLLLTKRPGNIVKLWADTFADESGPPLVLTSDFWPRNAAIGCTVVTQEEADRDIPKLLAAKEALKPAFAFLSMEPLLGPVDLEDIPVGPLKREDYVEFNSLTGSGFYIENDDGDRGASPCEFPTIDWIIVGGETDQGAHKARPSDPAWFRSLRDQCAAAGVPFHFKQWGEWQPTGDWYEDHPVSLPVRVYSAGAWTDCGSVDGDWVAKRGKAHDPCTLDGVRHDARPTARP